MIELYEPSHCYSMGFYPNSFMPSFVLFSFFSFSFFFLFFFSNYLQNGKSFDKQDTRVIKFQSPIDPINYRVITASTSFPTCISTESGSSCARPNIERSALVTTSCEKLVFFFLRVHIVLLVQHLNFTFILLRNLKLL
jgi:hypothetical protein